MAEEYFTKIDHESVGQYLFLFYGGSGVGKTRLAAQAPGPVLFLSCDTGKMGGLLSAVQYTPLQVKVTNYQQLLSLYPRLAGGANKDYTTLVVDSLTSLNQMVVRDIIAPTFRETARFDDWNLAVARMRSIINKLAEFGSHVIYIATEQVVKDEQLGRMMGLPNLPGKLSQEAPAGVDIVLHLTARSSFGADGKKKVIYTAATAPDEIWYAKDRSGTLPPEVVIHESNSFQPFMHLFANR